jgi:hypothetical protein
VVKSQVSPRCMPCKAYAQWVYRCACGVLKRQHHAIYRIYADSIELCSFTLLTSYTRTGFDQVQTPSV